MGSQTPDRSYKIKNDEEFSRDWLSDMPLDELLIKHGIKGPTASRNADRLDLTPRNKKED